MIKNKTVSRNAENRAPCTGSAVNVPPCPSSRDSDVVCGGWHGACLCGHCWEATPVMEVLLGFEGFRIPSPPPETLLYLCALTSGEAGPFCLLPVASH